jgi:hypothetical protein
VGLNVILSLISKWEALLNLGMGPHAEIDLNADFANAIKQDVDLFAVL